jgi:MoaA/NifB/PqqE/SkfB family radical SAM enzyme
MKLNDLMYFAYQIGRMNLRPKLRIPLSMYITLTNRCNNKCFYCRVHELPQEDIWTTSSLKDVLWQMKACGVRRIHLTGGEPMMLPDIGAIVTYAKELGFFVGISTNGHKVAERIDELKGIDVVFLSYDGPSDVHGRLRGYHNIREVESALSALKAAHIRVWTTTVLTRLNADLIEDIIDFAKHHHILANFNRLEFFSSSPCRREEQEKAFQKLISLKLAGAPIGSSLEYLKSVAEWPYEDRIIDSKPAKRYRCWAGYAFGHLDAGGNLYPCGWAALRMIPGINVLEYGFEEAWERIIPLDDCRSCSHACGVENNLLFSLNYSSIINALVKLSQ